ncbi:MAG: hypothetical protein JRI45_10555 [Deltaproteobacteria bacterium]|nr:hypothetical protein [Deltaproteobacteria bacterium]MBW2067700.1 hypothetical protein [Deltaproteobacteria bacterium]
MFLVNIFHDRKWDRLLKVALEMELARIPVPSPEGKTIRAYFVDLKEYATTFAYRKVEFLQEFQRQQGITLSGKYRRKYLAHCFDSYCEDLQNVALKLLEVEFAFLLNKERERTDDLEKLREQCIHRLQAVLTEFLEAPLRGFLHNLLAADSSWEMEHREKFNRFFTEAVNTIRKKGEKEIEKFFKNWNRRDCLAQQEGYKKFVEELKAKGLKPEL